jgi:hypothetical protein
MEHSTDVSMILKEAQRRRDGLRTEQAPWKKKECSDTT